MHEMPRTEQGGMQHMTLAEENHQQMWDDTLMMTVLPLAKIGKLLNRPQYVEEATYQFPAPCAEPDGPGDRAVVSRLEL
ncbi:Rhamnogalacturonides degradation protein RhiN [Klebsiella pneumoniae]|uniref:Rhamnogalacturonides degradation protein RhiN n=1 Tax=Klebsiella pneumoniae TaxID=573 RepID=A0A2X3JAJ9_KLEPN|nr:Rhamnogalacturonides degradation protein RhiN [Klebsiella pneumoniae]